MGVIVRDYRAQDLLNAMQIVNQPGTQEAEEFPVWARFAEENPALTFTNEEGTILACCGLVPYSRHRAEVWLTLSPAGTALGITILREGREVIEYFHDLGYTRLEALIPWQWYGNHKFVKALGFEEEALLLYASPLGDHAYMFAHIREGRDGLR